MKKIAHLFLVITFLILSQIGFSQLSGPKAIGPTGDYASITAALTAVSGAGGVNGPLLLELQSTYLSTVETFPINFTPIAGASATNTVTLRPATGANGLIISSGSLTAITLTGINWLTIDGRPGGTGLTVGNANNLQITSAVTGTNGTIAFTGNAQNNTLTYCNILGTANISASSGVITFGAATAANGNGNNTISYNDINALGSAVGIYAAGTLGFENTGNNINNNQIRDFYISSASTTATYGIRLQSNNSNWTINNNKFYQTSARDYSATAVIHIVISTEGSAVLNYHTITNNNIGGNASDGSGTYTLQGAGGQARFWPIQINGSTSTATSVQGNTISNINLSSAFAAGGSSLFIGIYVPAGIVNIGTSSPNTIGSTSAANSIVIFSTSATAAGPLVLGMFGAAAAPSNLNISNNNVGGIAVNVSTATSYLNLYAIHVTSATTGSVTINNNTVGSTTIANSIINNSGNTTTLFGSRGISCTSTAAATVSISGNTIANFSMLPSAANTGAILHGIYTNPSSSVAVYTINNNTIYSLKVLSDRIISTTTATAVTGILLFNSAGTAPTQSHSVNYNNIYGLSNTTTNATATYISGIIFTNGSAATVKSNCIGNKVHSLTTSSTGVAVINGIYTNNVALNIINNVVRLGIDDAGNSITSAFDIRGIYKNTGNAASVLNNTVFIGGTGVASGATNTAAFYKAGTNAADELLSNIFINKRSNVSGTGKHYAISLNTTTFSAINYNLYFANGTGGVLGTPDRLFDRANIIDWRTTISADAYSGFGDVTFTNATGNAASVNFLPTNANNLIGITHASVPTDILSITRAAVPTCGAYELSLPGIWSATASSTDWTTAGNWVNGVPASGSTIYIPASTTNLPIIAATTTVGRLINLNTGTISLTGSNTLTVTDEVRNSGTISSSTGTIALTGTTRQSLNGTINTANLTMNNIGSANIVGGSTNVANTLTVTSGTFTTGGFLTLRSTASGTARIDALVGGASVAGIVTIQRFIAGGPSLVSGATPGKRAFRLLSHPFTSYSDISQLTDNIDITGTGATSPATLANLTQTTTNSPSSFWYDATNALAGTNDLNGRDYGWQSFTNTLPTSGTDNNAWKVAQGISVLIRGTKNQTSSLDGTASYNLGDVTLDMAGQVNVATTPIATNLRFNGTVGAGWNLIGNPLPSPIEIKQKLKALRGGIAPFNNIAATAYVWNPNKTSTSRGGYDAIDISTTATGTYNLPMHGVVLVQTLIDNNAALTFSETDKVSSVPDLTFRTNTNGNNIAINLENSGVVLDETFIRFNSNSNINFEASDGCKMLNENSMYAITSDNVKTYLNSLPEPAINSSIKLGIAITDLGNYTFNFTDVDVPVGKTAFLKDNFIGTEQLITATGFMYNFSVTSNTASQGNNRFEIVMRSNASLPVTFTNIKAFEKNAGIQVEWTTVNELGISNYEVEKSTNGTVFNKTTSTVANNNGASSNNYNWLDANPVNGNNYYRIKAIEKGGTIKYTQVVNVKIGKTKNEFTITPTLVQNGVIQIQLSNVDNGKYTINIYNNVGQLVSTQNINHAGGSASQTINVAKLAKGSYHVAIQGNNVQTTQSIVIE